MAKETVKEEVKEEKPKLIKVRSLLPAKKDGGNPVALWERDTAHPDGEAFIAGDTPVEVAETGAVLKAISDKKIEKV